MQEVIRSLGDKLARLYPESTLLEYLLNAKSPVLLTVEKYLDIYASVPFINLYSGFLCLQYTDSRRKKINNGQTRRNDSSGAMEIQTKGSSSSPSELRRSFTNYYNKEHVRHETTFIIHPYIPNDGDHLTSCTSYQKAFSD
ncbi:hypothetical protein K0M31_014478 [Melipona bicolor]|uniref:Uncharacterized protein n=1 Tax=Melipona bicolor TaxID=60889 RepID=A0AA40G8X0_9HYME|nr:hypothetical protein K0M31_014478 [Melipona bicolor]